MKTSQIGTQPANSKEDWQKTQFANLIRYVPSGIYFARIRVAGKLRLIKRASERPKQLVLPTPEQFESFLNAIEDGGSGFSQPCADLVRFMAFGGFRKSEAANVTWADCDTEKGEMVVRWHSTRRSHHNRGAGFLPGASSIHTGTGIVGPRFSKGPRFNRKSRQAEINSVGAVR